MPTDTAPIDRQVAALGGRGERLVLAVSGGLDSMVLLDRAAALIPRERLVVATFDHGTGTAATRAASHVEHEAGARGLTVCRGGGAALRQGEAAWRTARWAFLRGVAVDCRAAAGGTPVVRIVTAHTADDQVETVLMRAMRGAGARGLAGLLATGAVARPFVRVPRSTLVGVALLRGLTWIDDPGNASMTHHRNRLRHETLPALERVRPGFAAWLLELSEHAAAWRAAMDAVAGIACPSLVEPQGGLSVAASDLAGYDASSLAVLWASIAGRVGVALDQRGTRRLAAFTISSTPGDAMPLSGGWQAARTRTRFILGHVGEAPAGCTTLSADGAGKWSRWRFMPAASADQHDLWSAVLPHGVALVVRVWEPADRIARGSGMVRVKRVLTEAGIAAADRVGWPVVVADDVIVWIPGVSRVLAATARSGRPGVCIRCEPSDR
ncbi:MAG: tRNA lysidine(34) synthetase TilS [Gemmatimonadaceae bacterium]|nr:tRNA lysidine(34) synthetase TilS [Gemmatimonadaceae bacterium]